MEMVLMRNHLSQSIHKLEIDLQTTLGLLGDDTTVPVEYAIGFQEESKNSLREFKNTWEMLENKISQLERSVNMAPTPTMKPTIGRWQMPVLSKMDQPSQVQFQHLPKPKAAPRRNLIKEFSEQPADLAFTATTGFSLGSQAHGHQAQLNHLDKEGSDLGPQYIPQDFRSTATANQYRTDEEPQFSKQLTDKLMTQGEQPSFSGSARATAGE